MKHYLWAVVSFDPNTGLMEIEWKVTTDPNPTHYIFQKWIRVAEFVWGET